MLLLKYILVFLFSLVEFTRGSNVNSENEADSEKITINSQNSKFLSYTGDFTTTSMIDVYDDKAMTQKTLSFEKVSYQIHKNGDVQDGLSFDTSKSNNAGIAENYLSDKGVKQGDGTYLVRFSNFNKCECFSVNQPALNYDIIEIGLLDTSGKATYISLSFGSEDKQDKGTLAKEIATACTTYTENMKKKFDAFWQEVEAYWKIKSSVKTIGDQIADLKNKQKTEQDALDQVQSDKKNFEKQMNETKKTLNDTQTSIETINKEVKASYKTINDIKALKALNEKNLTEKNRTLEKYTKESEATQKTLNEMNAKSNEYRNKSESIITQSAEVTKKVNEAQEVYTAEKAKSDALDKKIDEINKKITANGVSKSKYQKNVNSNKDFMDKLKIQDLPNTINKTKVLIKEYEEEIDQVMKDSNSTDAELAEMNKTIHESHQNVSNILNDPETVKSASEAKEIDAKSKIKELYDGLKKTFPIIPDTFMTNLWTFIDLNHKEMMNYLHAIKPSLYGLFDHTFNSNDPEKIAKKKRKQKKLRKMKKIKKK
jgi:DNA repair exonuclease SbcCD ATPase subunit